MSSLSKRLSITSRSPRTSAIVTSSLADEWSRAWKEVLAKDLVDQPLVVVQAETTVEEACEKLLSNEISCVAVQDTSDSRKLSGLFDYADVNAFLTLAATRHTLTPDELKQSPQVEAILAAAKAGKVPVGLVSNLSEKNALETLPHDASLHSLLAVFSRGIHRVLIQTPSSHSESYLGFVSDGAALTHLSASAEHTSGLPAYLSHPLDALALPSLYLYDAVVSSPASASVLDAMRAMSEQGVSSVAVLDDSCNGALLSAVSVTDIGKIVVPTQSNQILTTPLHQLVAMIREPFGSTDGRERYPVYSVAPESTLSYTIQKLLATNSHRLFVTDGSPNATPSSLGNLCGVVSIVDILALFAHLTKVPGVDPLRAQRARRMSASSSRSSGSRSSSRQGVRTRVDSAAGRVDFFDSAAARVGHSPRTSMVISPNALAGGPAGSPVVISPGGVGSSPR